MAYISFQPSDYFNTVLYTSNSGASPRTITGVGFNPDMIWVKNRDSASYNHVLADNVRGIGKIIQPDTTVAEISNSAAGTITSTNSDGFVLTAGSSNLSNYDVGTNKQVVWNWKANGSGSANSDGSINTTYTSANTTSGFSISTYTGTGSVGTIGHGLGSVPKMIIVKRLDSASSWSVYHSALGNANQLNLNGTDASTSSSGWNSTNPTSSVFSIGSTGSYNGSGNTYVAYCFAEKKGFSKFGSYTGNGSADGTFVYTGFRPAFFLVKNTSATESWYIIDNKRPAYNTNNYYLLPNTSGAEGTSTSLATSLLSNGVKIENSDTSMNTSGQTYIYMAFAEHPLVSSNDIPATAR